jgi:NAD(P)-dependent dehydrogenase (short-subunit alcohol dehydrogenase family)
MELKDRLAIVTGAGKGLGKAIAEKFSEEGASVALWDIDLDSAEDVADALDPSGAELTSS